MFKGLVDFLKSKTFFKHLAIFLVSFFLLCWIIFKWMAMYTAHNETISVPDFTGVKISNLDNFIADKHVRYVIIDSLYDPKSPAGVVVRQEPEKGEQVKENRRVYLYVTSILPPSITMPKLVDRSLRQAMAMISSYGLKMAKPQFRADQCANCVLEQRVKGKKIEPGTAIPKGTVIELIVGKGLSAEETGVPCLQGLSRKEAADRLSEASLNIGSVVYDSPKDSAISRVYKQIPSCGKDGGINIGSVVDIYMTADKSKLPDTATDSDNPDDDGTH